ncbi:hypothetical protein V1477_004028 [Vespula maculifrons]|uniref:Uncharacterized protein n=1 Tax=Vespula maculifrons TaxID=7453 RepID=A0ABD2CQG1_VESMC
MKAFVVLLALAAVAIASPVGLENVQQENLAENEADLSKIKVSGGIKCRGKRCKGHIGIGGSWYVADDGTLVSESADDEVDDGIQKSYNVEEEDEESADDENNSVEIVFHSNCNSDEVDNSKCNKAATLGIHWLRLPSGEVVPHITENENTAVEQVDPTTAKWKWNGKVSVRCRKRKCRVDVSGGVHN